MVSSIYPPYPPDLTQQQTDFLVTSAKEWAVAHGLTVRPPAAFTEVDQTGTLAGAAPVTLFPSLFPLNCFHEALILQTAYNEMYANIARDEEWLESVVRELAPIDDFIAKLWDIHVKVKAEGYAQNLSLGLFRSDYMVHIDPSLPAAKPSIKQVEFNTIASSFGGLSSRTCSLHRYLLQTAAYPREAATMIRPDLLPTNASIEKLAGGIAAAHMAYGRPKNFPLTCVLFITQPIERNVFDQKHLEYALVSYHRLKVFRVPFNAILEHTTIGTDRALLYHPPAFPERTYEVTTVYLRAGYSPDEYNSPEAWSARLHLERSAAVKCPSVLTQLAGTKKVQQILATPGAGHVSRFLPFEGIATRLENTFAPMYPLDAESDAGKEGRRLATDPEASKRFVLKPQREGGGNNIYRAAIPGFLKSIPESQWPAYVLMEMIETPPQRNTILRNGELQSGGVICELGIFGTCLWRNGPSKAKTAEKLASNSGMEEADEYAMPTTTRLSTVDAEAEEAGIIENEEAGYLLRTKGDQSEEGGVAAGFGAIDSCCLFDV